MIVMLLALLPATASAQQWIELGDDAAVRRVQAPCWDQPGILCAWWQPEGRLSFGERPELELATTFARSRSGRIFAMISAFAPRTSLEPAPYPTGSMLLYSDDLGATWSAARWPDPQLEAVALAFDPAGPNGVAVGRDGSVWSSDDEGLTWRRRRGPSGAGFRAAWVRARTCVLEDALGALWISRDGGFAIATLADPGARVEERGGELIVRDDERTTRIDARGVVRR